jgi:signal transduction histidine kinase
MRRPGLPKTLMMRILSGSALSALLAAAALAVLLASLLSLRSSIDQEAHAKDTVAAALMFESRVTEFDSALHAYLLTTNRVFLTSLEQSRDALEPAHRQLAGLVTDDPKQRTRVAVVWSLVGSYLQDYAAPLITIARLDPAAARGSVAANEAKRRSDAIDMAFGGVIGLEQSRALTRREAVRHDTTRAIGAALAAAIVAVLLIFGFGAWVARHVTLRLAQASAAAAEVARGELTTRLDEGGAAELAELAAAFNTMAGSLEVGRRELLAQNALLQHSEQQKSELITMVSHELRTPLTSLLGFTNLLLTRQLDEADRRHYLEIVHRESRRLASIVDTFLDLRSIEEGRLELRREAVDLSVLARDHARFLLAHAQDHSLALDVPPEEALVDGDRDRLSQVIGNLVSNAVKYSPAGGPVEVVVLDAADKVRLEVTDHGLGIPTEDQPRVFTKFFRGRATDSGISGTGLGLAVAREIVEAHGGSIGFVSSSGHGSTFWLELPKFHENGATAGDPAHGRAIHVANEQPPVTAG